MLSDDSRQMGVWMKVFVHDGWLLFSAPDISPLPTPTLFPCTTLSRSERLTLQSDTGTLFYFDVPSRQWVSSPPSPSTLAKAASPSSVATQVIDSPTLDEFDATVHAVIQMLPTASPDIYVGSVRAAQEQ